MADSEKITFGEAMRRLGVSKHTIGRVVKEHGLRIYINPLDKREKLLDATEVEKLRRPQPLRTGDESGKLAA